MAAPMPAELDADGSSFFYAPLAPLDIPGAEEGDAFEPEIILPSIFDSAPANTQKAAAVLAEASLPDTTPPLPAPVAADSERAEEFISFGDVEQSPAKQSPSKQSLQDQPAEEDGPATEDGALPWAKSSSRIRAPLLRLHNEIVQFCQALTPTAEEFAARSAAIARVGAVIQATWPSAEVQVFGSFLTGLFLPTSDLDLVIINSGCRDVPGGLRALATGLTRKGMARNMQVIAKAKVPIIKFEDPASSFNFDISFDVANGPVAAEYVSTLMHQLPAMRPLVLVLKIFLQQREFNEVYTGGIGSYALLMMVAASLLLHQCRQDDSDAVEASLGVLLLDFFRMYGRALNVDKVGISVRDGGRFFAKASKPDPFLQPDRPHFLAVEDPKDGDNDLCKGSYQILKIRQAFDYAYQQLAAPARRSESILQRIIRTDSVLMGRTPIAEDSEPPL
ncbi:hypothetical protein WJX73_006042 [Symbiochloris irregularis]|uniref:polynucleotide adenylyltransferase n=1 Tax=Symbiochloris irregularis TaxID=706552 RepID=A0AAW1PAC7_9CHLO